MTRKLLCSTLHTKSSVVRRLNRYSKMGRDILSHWNQNSFVHLQADWNATASERGLRANKTYDLSTRHQLRNFKVSAMIPTREAGYSYYHRNMSDSHHPKYLYKLLDRPGQDYHSIVRIQDNSLLKDSKTLTLQSSWCMEDNCLLLNHPSKHKSEPLSPWSPSTLSIASAA
ncbi:uncharacterized protein LY89DRAFT_182733 [Mollisia scopiformis]|uniref:Uncharacterized protein n=1 Tax=Mollisia scopiformis TaxID=149040 RepID=A0A194XTS8_MOLSC|nr:uncharacterized protein LY89DRAFT_182733 [Mollisia scopiformis]KUJ23444.1 hypothetical protein LY89DRAFT_182733 [Mollisia scopiformis]